MKKCYLALNHALLRGTETRLPRWALGDVVRLLVGSAQTLKRDTGRSHRIQSAVDALAIALGSEVELDRDLLHPSPPHLPQAGGMTAAG